MWGSVPGFQASASIPLRIPTTRSPSSMNFSWRPNPPSGVSSSRAWVGLTVTARSANVSPPLRMFIRPYHSNPRPVEEVGVLDEEDLRSLSGADLLAVQPCGLAPVAERDRERRPRALQGRRRRPDLAI